MAAPTSTPAQMPSREEVFRRVVEVLLAQEKKPHRIAVFGSWARGEQGPDSDLDVLVEYARPFGLFDLIQVEHVLQDSIGLRVDVHTMDGLKPRVKARVVGDMLSVYP